MAKCYTYARASSYQQVTDGESIPHQNKRTYELYETKLKPEGIDFGGVVEDPAVSAFKTPFDKRPGGKYLVEVLRPGDHVVFDKVDRIWRSLTDFIRLRDWFKRRMVAIHIVNMQGMTVSSDSSMGDFVLQLFVMIAELESQIKSERNTLAARMLRDEGRPATFAPLGLKPVKRNGKNYLDWDVPVMRSMKKCHELRQSGLSWEQVAQEMSRLHLQHPKYYGNTKNRRGKRIGKLPEFSDTKCKKFASRYQLMSENGVFGQGSPRDAAILIRQMSVERKRRQAELRANAMKAGMIE